MSPTLIGVVPQFIAEKVPAMLGCDTGLGSPFPDATEDGDLDSGVKRRRRSVGGELLPKYNVH